MVFEVPCWYLFNDVQNLLIIWEGVMAIWEESHDKKIKSVELWKQYDDNYVYYNPPHIIKNITSEGYWTCAEVTGKFNNGKYFFYHAITPEKSKILFDFILKYLNTFIVNIEISLDPNPYRNWTESECQSRLRAWKNLCYHFSKKYFKINENYNMPI
uniref:LAGLIDADG_2 domain-containing protein n=1 Tax=Strongyloides papillosus TaxID=174720 RepID=A0A0N5BCU2_STREA